MKKIIYFPEITKDNYQKQVGGSDSYTLDKFGLVFASPIEKIETLVQAKFIRKLEVEDKSLVIGKKTDKTYEEWSYLISNNKEIPSQIINKNLEPVVDSQEEPVVDSQEELVVDSQEEPVVERQVNNSTKNKNNKKK